jgi:multidrug efflux system membrane fusion protein
MGNFALRPAGLATLVMLLGSLSGCGESKSAQRVAKPVKVVATRPVTNRVTDYQDFTGRLSAVYTVDIRARVSGYVEKVPFKEGERVRKGDLLVLIDPRPYLADLNLARANHELSKADRNLQEKNKLRAEAIVKSQAVSQEDYETTVATFQKSKATVDAMKANEERAHLYFDFTRVTAPFDGRISRRLIDPGNLVTADTTILTTLVTEDPLYAYFDVDERTYLDLVTGHGHSASLSSDKSPLGNQGSPMPVLMSLANESTDSGFTHAGFIDFVDNQVVATTGTLRLRGNFPNPQGVLKPGLFVRIRLPLSQPYDAIVVPEEAVLNDQGRKYVWVINDKDEVEYRSVEPGQALKGLTVIKRGLSLKDRVMISGMQRVRQGAKVEVDLQAPSKPPPSPLTQILVSQSTAQAAASPKPEKRMKTDDKVTR